MSKIELSVIVPLYNEAKRAPPFLDELLHYNKRKWEFIFVDDGSKDDTLEIIKPYRFNNKTIIAYKKNRGKGYAVGRGVEKAKGDFILFIDADGSIHPSQIKNMLHYLKKYDVVVGTRASKQSEVKTSLVRKFVGTVFNHYVNLLYNINIRDNLCGFKAFKKNTAKELFKNLISERWVFDVELFYKIRKRNIFLYQLPLKWEHRGDSKMKIIDPLKMALELFFLRFKLLFR